MESIMLRQMFVVLGVAGIAYGATAVPGGLAQGVAYANHVQGHYETLPPKPPPKLQTEGEIEMPLEPAGVGKAPPGDPCPTGKRAGGDPRQKYPCPDEGPPPLK